MSYFESRHIVEVHPVLLHWWIVPNLRTLVMYTLSYYFDEMFPVVEFCWRIPSAITWLIYTLSQYIVELWSILKHCCRYSRKFVGSQSQLSITLPKSPESCQTGCKCLCSMICTGCTGCTGCTSAKCQDWKHLNNVIRQRLIAQCSKIGNNSAI